MRAGSAFLVGALGCLALMSDTGAAQSDERLALAHRLLDAMDFENAEIRRRDRVVPGQTEAQQKVQKASVAFQAKHLPPQKLREPLAHAYASLFTADELTRLVAFYDSPEGKKLTRLQPELANAIQAVISQVYRDHFEEYSTTVLQIPKELLKRPPD